MTNAMTVAEARARIRETLQSWHSIGQIARFLGIPRTAVAREIARMDERGMLESRVQRFWRSGDYRLGKVWRLVGIECAPVLPGSPDARRQEFLAALFTCQHGIEMCSSCSTVGRTCGHRCVECSPESVFEGVA